MIEHQMWAPGLQTRGFFFGVASGFSDLVDWRGDAVEDDCVQIQNCNWLHEANLVVSVLAGDGIEAFVPDAYTLGSRPELAAALGGVRVLVRASDFDRAREVLAAAIPDLPTSGHGEHVE